MYCSVQILCFPSDSMIFTVRIIILIIHFVILIFIRAKMFCINGYGSFLSFKIFSSVKRIKLFINNRNIFSDFRLSCRNISQSYIFLSIINLSSFSARLCIFCTIRYLIRAIKSFAIPFFIGFYYVVNRRSMSYFFYTGFSLIYIHS